MWLNRYGGELIENDHQFGQPAHIKVEAILSRYRGGSGEYIGKVLDYLEVCWAKAGFDKPLDGTLVEYNTGSAYEEIRIGSFKDQRIR